MPLNRVVDCGVWRIDCLCCIYLQTALLFVVLLLFILYTWMGKGSLIYWGGLIVRQKRCVAFLIAPIETKEAKTSHIL